MHDGATRLIAIRHGETAWNADGRLQGQLDIPLNARGQRQAACLAEALRHEDLAAIYSSDLCRARATAQALAGPLGLAVHTDAGLRERCFGVFEGATREEVALRWPEERVRWQSRDPEHTPPGGESLRVFSARCVASASRLAQAHPGQTIALVCHGGVLDSLYRAATGQALDAPRTWLLTNAGINRLLHSGGRFTLVGWSDTSHLAVLDAEDALARDELG